MERRERQPSSAINAFILFARSDGWRDGSGERTTRGAEGEGPWGAEEGEGEINGKDVDVIRY